MISLSGFTEIEETFLTIVKNDQGTRTADYYTRLEIIYEMSLDATKISRSVYTFWMVIGDVGGLSGVLYSVCSYLISVFTHQKPENHLVGQLYQTSEPKNLDPLVPQPKTRLDSGR